MVDYRKPNEGDRIRAAAQEAYETDYLVVKTGITRTQAEQLVKSFGYDRVMLMKHARNLA